MSRHIADKRTPSDGGRVRHFTEIERRAGEEGSHPSTEAVHRRPSDPPQDNRRAAEFVRIERGHRT